MEPVLVDRRDALAIVTINRPERRNALDAEAKVALREALAAVAEDDGVRAVVLTGSGGHFCAGQDLKGHARTLEEEGPEATFATVADDYVPVIRSLTTMSKPVVAAIEGACVGAGLGIALACDLRVVATSASFATAFSAIGLTTDSGLAYTLPRMVGDAKARELVLLGESFSGEQAHAWGLVARLTQGGGALEQATELGSRLAAGPTAAYAESKALLAATWDHSLDETMQVEAEAQLRAGSTEDHQLAVKAFLAKERPVFSGR